MTTPAWHEFCRIRDDVRTGSITLDEFAADLNAVRTGEAPPVYKDPAAFFSRTYATFNMKGLVRDVLLRLADKGGKPIVRIQVAYGGGKTHTLITLLHLAEHGMELTTHPVVKEFLDFAGESSAPATRVALLPFDKFDVKLGLSVRGPGGEYRTVRTPWGALAYQLGGDAGYARVADHDKDYVAPAEPVLVELLRMAEADDLAPLILIDEAVWYCRGAVNEDPRRLGTLKDFFQVLTQAVAKVSRAALVATLISSEVEAHDHTGVQVLKSLEGVFGRLEETVEPVAKEDVAEVLRRRLFEALPGEPERRSVIDAVMARMQKLPLSDAQKSQRAYDRLLQAYPFHADFLEVLYQKWTQLPGFQRTRGALRLLAQGLRDREGNDPMPLVGPGVLLGAHGKPLTAAMTELIKCTELGDTWTPVLVGELEKAQGVQREFPGLEQGREMESAVAATFLHSHPRGQKADPLELVALLAHSAVDPVALGEGLKKWRGCSWFLTDEPDIYRLGTNPNLTHMHVEGMGRVKPEEVEDELRSRVQQARLAAADPGVVPHNLPRVPKDVQDSPELHFVVLGPEHSARAGASAPDEVVAFFTTTTGPKNPRTYRNAVVALCPDSAKLAGLRVQVLRVLGWRKVEKGEEVKLLSKDQLPVMRRRKTDDEAGIAAAVRATWEVVAAVDEDGEVTTMGLPSGTDSAFERVKSLLVEEERLLATTLDPELLLPESYLDIWSGDEKRKRVKDLVAAFAQFPRLPRLLRPQSLLDSLARAAREGTVVLEVTRADGSRRSIWRREPLPEDLDRPELEVVPLPYARLHGLAGELLVPGALEDLWPTEGDPLKVSAVESYFDGVGVPALADPGVLDQAVRQAVKRGLLMARAHDGTTYLRQELPDDRAVDHDLDLMIPPAPVLGSQIGPRELPEAWDDKQTTAAEIAVAMEKRRGGAVPWVIIRDAIAEALSNALFERADGTWPCGPEEADKVTFRLPERVVLTADDLVDDALHDIWTTGTAKVSDIKTALERVRGRALPDEVLRRAVASGITRGLFTLEGTSVDLPEDQSFLATRLAKPKTTLFAEALLDLMQLDDLVEAAAQLKEAAPGKLEFAFRVAVTAEGEKPDPELLEQLNAILAKIKPGWQFE